MLGGQWIRRGIPVELRLLLVPLEGEEFLVGLQLVLAQEGRVLKPKL